MDAKPCAHCGQPVSDTALKCPHCGGTGPRAKSNAQGLLLGCGLTLAIVLGMCAYLGSSFSRAVSNAPTSSAQDATATTRARWDAVAATVQQNGATVQPFDPSAPATMRIMLPRGVVTTAQQARELAVTTRERLGSDAIVYVKESTGYTLAKAAPWGVE